MAAAQTSPIPEPRIPLSKERVLKTAVVLADQGGIETLTMRKLAQELGVEAMSLYHYVAKKDDILDGIVELVVREINETVSNLNLSPGLDDWKRAMRARILAARQVLLTHRWAPDVLETRTSGSLEVMEYVDGLLRIFKEGGFSYDAAHHAMHALGSRAFGFAQELFEPDGEDDSERDPTAGLEDMADRFPHIVEMLAQISHNDPDSTLGWCDDQTEFEFGLDLILDGLDRLRGAR